MQDASETKVSDFKKSSNKLEKQESLAHNFFTFFNISASNKQHILSNSKWNYKTTPNTNMIKFEYLSTPICLTNFASYYNIDLLADKTIVILCLLLFSNNSKFSSLPSFNFIRAELHIKTKSELIPLTKTTIQIQQSCTESIKFRFLSLSIKILKQHIVSNKPWSCTSLLLLFCLA